MKIHLGKGGRQFWLPGGYSFIERAGQAGTETPPAGLKAFAPLAGGNRSNFHTRMARQTGAWQTSFQSTSFLQRSRSRFPAQVLQGSLAMLQLLLPALLTAKTGMAQINSEVRPPGTPTVIQLSLKKAVEIALAPQGNSRVQLALESVKLAKARSAQARAALLPNLDGYVSQMNQTRNLQAFGIGVGQLSPFLKNLTFVGPFDTFDARANLSQTILDFSAIRKFQASRSGVVLAQAEDESTRDQTREQVAKAYLAALRARAALEAAESNVGLADALLGLATNQKEAGTGIGIEVTRAKVQLANEKQRFMVAQNESTRANLQLLRSMGLDLEASLELTDILTYTPVEATSPVKLLQTALDLRADWKAQQKREATQKLNYSAIKMERLPSVIGLADYGTIGTGVNEAIPTRTYGVSVRVPVFDGGRRDARRAEGYVQLQQESIRSKDLRQQIELEIRLALDSLRSAEDQVKAATEGLNLAEEELASARRRYEGGVSNSLEFTDAQNRLERARENHISALFSFNLARIDLAAATGTIRGMVQ